MKPAAPEHLIDVVQMPKKLSEGAADHAVGFVAVHHDRGNGGCIGPHDRLGDIGGHALPRHQIMIGAPIVAIARVVLGVHDLEVGQRPDLEAGPFTAPLDHLGATDQDRRIGGLFHDRLRRTKHALVLTLGKDDAAGGGAGGLEHRPHDHGRAEHRAIELLLIGRHILERALGHAGFHGRFSHGTGDNADEARVEGLGDQIVGAKAQLLAGIGGGSLGARGGAGQRSNAFDTGELHLVIDLGRAHIQRATEDEGETQDVIDLIGIIAAPRGDDRIRRHGAGVFGRDLGGGVGQRENDRARGHFGDHLGL